MSTVVPDDSNGFRTHFDAEQIIMLPACERCGSPVREQRCDPVDRTEPGDAWVTMVSGPTYNDPCGCIVRPGRHEPDRTPSGEHTSADTDDVVANINEVMEDWELDAARWSADGSHEHDPPHWTRMDYGNGAMSGQADWGCDDVADRMRPGSTACFPWQGARR